MTRRLVDLAHECIGEVIRPGDTVIDATVGNGLDTLFLARKVGPPGTVYGFDIQAEAISLTRNRLADAGVENRVKLVLLDHAMLERCLIEQHRRRIKAVMFNLGYLPGGNKNIITNPTSTQIALESACAHLVKGGRISVLCYPGHPGGRLETEVVKGRLARLNDRFRMIIHRPAGTSRAAPELILLERTV